MLNPHLLIVDFDDRSRGALAESLRASGYSVREAGNPLDGLRAFIDRTPRLVIVDPWPFLPASFQMIDRLRRERPGADVPVVLVTSAPASEHLADVVAAGCEAYLEKPCPHAIVHAVLARLLAPPTPFAPPARAERPPIARGD